MTYVGVVIFTQDIKNTAVESWFDVVKLRHIGVFNGIDKHLTTNDNEERGQNFA